MAINAKDSELPPCFCGATAWRSGSSSFGAMMQLSKVCNECGRIGEELILLGGHAFIVPEAPTVESEEAWINGVLLRTFCAFVARFTAVCNVASEGELARVNRMLELPEDTKGDTVPKAMYSRWSDALEESDRAVRAKVWAMPEFARGAIPPKVPTTLLCYTRVDDVWTLHTSEATANIDVPADPTRTAHDAFFSRIFTSVMRATGIEFAPCEVPNRYRRDELKNEPWYTFAVRGITYTVGPRKSVVSIAVDPSTRDQRAALRRLGERDGVTHGDDYVHAYGEAKTVEYLSQLLLNA